MQLKKGQKASLAFDLNKPHCTSSALILHLKKDVLHRIRTRGDKLLLSLGHTRSLPLSLLSSHVIFLLAVSLHSICMVASLLATMKIVCGCGVLASMLACMAARELVAMMHMPA